MLAIFAIWIHSVQGTEASAKPAASPRALFVDDSEVLYRAGTKRVLVPLKRYSANPLIRGGEKPWEVAIAWTSVYRDPETGRYQLWYQAFAGDAAHDKTRRCTVCYAESEDGIHFTKPNLGLFDFNGIKETSIVLVANGGTSDRYGVSVLVDPSDVDPKRRYKMAYFDFTQDQGQEYPGLNVAFSSDGIHWTKYRSGPLSRAAYGDYGESVPFADDKSRPWAVPLSMADALDVLYDKPRGKFAIYGKMWIDGPNGGMFWKHAMGRIESSDFIHWSKPELVLAPDDNDPDWLEFHTAPVLLYHGYYFAPIQILNRAKGGGVVDIELATSRDGLNWQRPFRKPFWLTRSDGNQFDSGAIFLCPQVVSLEQELRFYYGAYSQGATGSDDSKLASGIGLATMMRDRFAGLQAVPHSDQPTLKHPLQNIGQVTLKPIRFGPSEIIVNADASAGMIRVEILDANAKRIRGFSYDEAIPLRGDSLEHLARWKFRGLNEVAPGEYIIRLHLEKATVYALSLKPSDKRNEQTGSGKN